MHSQILHSQVYLTSSDVFFNLDCRRSSQCPVATVKMRAHVWAAPLTTCLQFRSLSTSSLSKGGQLLPPASQVCHLPVSLHCGWLFISCMHAAIDWYMQSIAANVLSSVRTPSRPCTWLQPHKKKAEVIAVCTRECRSTLLVSLMHMCLRSSP